VKIEFTPTGGSKATLGDDSSRHTIEIESLGGGAVVQALQRFRAAAVVYAQRGLVSGELTFTASKSHADRATAVGFFKTEYGRLNGQGQLVITEAATTLTMDGVVLRGVQCVRFNGLRWTIRYTFAISTIT
jgi:hypothetical protein